VLIPAGRQVLEWMAVDDAGNMSEPVEQIIEVYPRVRFDVESSTIGEAISAEIKVRLTGDSPKYPVIVNFAISELSEANQDDLNFLFDITSNHQVVIEAGELDSVNREALISIPVIYDYQIENDELLLIDLIESEINEEVSELLLVDDEHKQHALTITDFNLAPEVGFKLEQNGVEVSEVITDEGEVTLTAIVTDGNGNDTHTLEWDVNSLGLNAPLGHILSFDPINVPSGSYQLSVVVTDDGMPQLSADANLRIDVVNPEEELSGREDDVEATEGFGAISIWFLCLMLVSIASAIRHQRYKA